MRRRQQTLVGVTGIAATLLLHSLFFAVALWNGDGLLARPMPPDAVGAGANTGKEEGEVGERRMMVMLTPEFEADVTPLEPPPELPEPVMEQSSILAITGPDILPLPPIELPGEAIAEADAELMARAQFAGMYESQVRARILRAWKAPDESAPEPDFSCLVQIRQQRDGRVREVAIVLDKCNGTPEWQQSLVDAIQVSSPLPAPPHPSAFVDNFALVFNSSAVSSQKRVDRH
jgi:hypothetical protein